MLIEFLVVNYDIGCGYHSIFKIITSVNIYTLLTCLKYNVQIKLIC